MIVCGCLALVIWWQKLLYILLGLLPVVLVVMGMLALSAGIRQLENLKIKNKADISSVKQRLIRPDKKT